MRLSIVLFDGFTALDIVGGYEVLALHDSAMLETIRRLIAGEDVAKTIPLGIAYYPDPPFGNGTPDTAPAWEKAQALTRASPRSKHLFSAR